MIKILEGNLFDSNAHAIVNAVNCVGVMGKGIALEFKRRYPAMFADYVRRCRDKKVQLGKPYPYFVNSQNTFIINFPTKGHWRSSSRITDIIAGLDYLVAHLDDWGIKSLALPALGCGHGGLAWPVVKPILCGKLGALSLPVEIYAPHELSI